jgi:hypothetical protein
VPVIDGRDGRRATRDGGGMGRTMGESGCTHTSMVRPPSLERRRSPDRISPPPG